MPKKRTKQQKTRAVYHYAYPAGRSFTGLDQNIQEQTKKKPVIERTEAERLYQYDPLYTRRDLLKTFLITTIMIAVEVGLYFWA